MSRFRSSASKLRDRFLPQSPAKSMGMKRFSAKAGLILLAAATPALASAQASLEGQWKNARGSVVVRVSPCGNALCGVVVDANERAKAGARKGGTPNLI